MNLPNVYFNLIALFIRAGYKHSDTLPAIGDITKEGVVLTSETLYDPHKKRDSYYILYRDEALRKKAIEYKEQCLKQKEQTI